MIIDSHCHVLNKYYDDKKEIVNKFTKNKKNKLINCGYNPEINKEIIETIKCFPSMYGSIGFSPQEVDSIEERDFLILEEQLRNSKIVAIGEIGLDFYHRKDNKNKQIDVFKKQLKIAKKYNIPIIIHCRNASDELIKILKEFPEVKGMIHSFTGSLETAKEYIKLGYLLSINGILTFKNSNLKDVIKEISIENIVSETDSPYLTPEPHRGERNEPILVDVIIKKIAEIKKLDYNYTINKIEDNINRVFDF